MTRLPRWVTGDHWFDATATLWTLQHFRVGAGTGDEHLCAWINHFVRLYEPVAAAGPAGARCAFADSRARRFGRDYP